MRALHLILLVTALGNTGCRARPQSEPTTHPLDNVTAKSATADSNGSQQKAAPSLTTSPSPDTSVSPEESSMLTGKPYLSLQVDAFHVPFEVFVNSGYVTTDVTGTTASEKWPINPFLRSGTNEIGVLMYGWADGPPGTFEEDAKLTLRVSLKQADSDEGPQHELFVMTFGGNSPNSDSAAEGSTSEGSFDSAQGFRRVNRGDVELGPVKIRRIPEENVTILTRSLNLRLPFPEWAFFHSDRQKPTVELSNSDVRVQHDILLLAYDEIWRLLSSRDVDRLLPLFEERSREIDLSLYQEPGTTQTKLREAFESALADPSCTLEPLRRSKGRWYYNVAPGGQLARLTTSDHGGAAIRFRLKSSDYARVFPIMFRKEGSRYIVSR